MRRRPKGVVLSHASFHVQSLAKIASVGYCREDVYLHLAPLFHVGGLSSMMAVLMAGACQVGRDELWKGGFISYASIPFLLQALLQTSQPQTLYSTAGPPLNPRLFIPLQGLLSSPDSLFHRRASSHPQTLYSTAGPPLNPRLYNPLQVILPRFEARPALTTISQLGITSFIAVPTMVQDLAAAATEAMAEAPSGVSSMSDHPYIPSFRCSLDRRPRSWPSVQRILVGAGGTSDKMQVSLKRHQKLKAEA